MCKIESESLYRNRIEKILENKIVVFNITYKKIIAQILDTKKV